MPETDPSPYFRKRRHSLEGQLEGARSTSVKGLLRDALSGTDDTAQALVDLARLAQQLIPALNVIWSHSVTAGDVRVENLKELFENYKRLVADTAVDHKTKEAVSVLLADLLQNTKGATSADLTTLILVADAFRIVTELFLICLVEKIYKPDREEFDLEAVQKGIIYAIDAIPVVGPVFSAVQTIKSIITARRTELTTADAFCRYLEEYIEACRLWCTALRKVIHVYEGFIKTAKGDA